MKLAARNAFNRRNADGAGVDPRAAWGAATPSDIIFRGPRIEVFVNGSRLDQPETKVVIELRGNSSVSKSVTVGRGGSVSLR